MLALISTVFALVSMVLTREPGALAILWIPNALAIGWFWVARPIGPLLPAAAVAVGVTLANAIYGDGLLVAGSLGLANGIEVFLACVLVERALHFQPAHASYSSYLRFLGLVCLVPAMVAGTLGTAVAAVAYGAHWPQVYVGWALGGFASTLALTPIVPVMLRAARSRTRPGVEEIRGFFYCIGCLLLSFVIFAQLVENASPIISAGTVLSIFALWLTVSTVIAVTAGLLVSAALIAFFDPALFSLTFGGASAPAAFGLIFGCLVIPGNLIALAIAARRETEQQAQELSRLKSDFLATMSHEMRTPLNAILGMFQLLQNADLPERQRTHTSVGQLAAKRLLKLLSDVLDMSRLEAKAVRLSRRDVRLGDMVSNWREMAEAAMQGHGKSLEVAVALAPNLPEVIFTDEDHLTQIIQNLVDNAIRFTDRGSITIGVFLTSGQGANPSAAMEFRVTDTGCGIPADRLPEIFERFRQIDGSMKRKVGGSGLGLAICNDLAQLMKGTLTVDSVVDVGTTFRLTIPLDELARCGRS